jgi:hypothetical protein
MGEVVDVQRWARPASMTTPHQSHVKVNTAVIGSSSRRCIRSGVSSGTKEGTLRPYCVVDRPKGEKIGSPGTSGLRHGERAVCARGQSKMRRTLLLFRVLCSARSADKTSLLPSVIPVVTGASSPRRAPVWSATNARSSGVASTSGQPTGPLDPDVSRPPRLERLEGFEAAENLDRNELPRHPPAEDLSHPPERRVDRPAGQALGDQAIPVFEQPEGAEGGDGQGSGHPADAAEQDTSQVVPVLPFPDPQAAPSSEVRP